jgi:two-component system LytT family sensor kinase
MFLWQKIRSPVLYHLLFWIATGAVWYYLRFQDYASRDTALLVTVIKTADLALMVYTANYLLIPRLLYRKKYGWFILAFILMIVASSLYKMYLIGKVTGNPALQHFTGNIKGRIYDNVIPHFFLVIAGVAVKLLFDHTRMQKRLAEVAKERSEAELNFLKSQINPHFLFNSLNSVYFLIDKQNTEARNALHRFSDMLRYQLYEVRDKKMPIEREVGYLQDYMNLQRLRLDENASTQLHIDEDMRSFLIEPLLLIPFVENAFKHLSRFSNGRANEIIIGLSAKNGSMDFSVRNTTEGRVKEIGTHGGIGLENVRRRLQLLYPGEHELQITEKEGWFNVHLKLNLHQ